MKAKQDTSNNIVLTKAAWDKLQKLIKNPPPASKAMKELYATHSLDNGKTK